MQRFSLFISFLILSLCSMAQPDTDSLRRVMQSNRPYEQQINAAIQLVESYHLKNFDSTIIVGDKALQMARKKADSSSVAKLKHQIGVASYFSGKYDVAAKNFIESISIFEKMMTKRNWPLFTTISPNCIAKQKTLIRHLAITIKPMPSTGN